VVPAAHEKEPSPAVVCLRGEGSRSLRDRFIEAKPDRFEVLDPVVHRLAVDVVKARLAGAGERHHDVAPATRERGEKVAEVALLNVFDEFTGPDEVENRRPRNRGSA